MAMFPPKDEPPKVVEDFDAWAAVSARLMKRSDEEKQQILEGMWVVDEWLEAEKKWNRALADDLPTEDRKLFSRYQSIIGKELERRKKGEEYLDLSDLGPAPVIEAKPKPEAERDFRQGLVVPAVAPPDEQLMQQAHTLVLGPRAPSQTASNGVQTAEADRPPTGKPAQDNFVGRLAPPDIQPVAPGADQVHTAPANYAGVHDSLQTAQSALSWPVEKYAQFCAELNAAPKRSKVICADYGIRGDLMLDHIHDVWKKRFAADEQLHVKWAELVAQFGNTKA